MVDVFHNDGWKCIVKIICLSFIYFRQCDHDFDCGPGDTSDETGCGKEFPSIEYNSVTRKI